MVSMSYLSTNFLCAVVIIVVIIIFAILCVCALYSIAKLHSDLNRIAEEIKFLRRRDDMIELNNRSNGAGQDRGTYYE